MQKNTQTTHDDCHLYKFWLFKIRYLGISRYLSNLLNLGHNLTLKLYIINDFTNPCILPKTILIILHKLTETDLNRVNSILNLKRVTLQHWVHIPLWVNSIPPGGYSDYLSWENKLYWTITNGIVMRIKGARKPEQIKCH